MGNHGCRVYEKYGVKLSRTTLYALYGNFFEIKFWEIKILDKYFINLEIKIHSIRDKLLFHFKLQSISRLLTANVIV